MNGKKLTMFNLDSPTSNQIDKLITFSGWYIDSAQYSDLIMYVNKKPYAQIDCNHLRKDVQDAHPNEKFSLISGWKTDFVVDKGFKNKSVLIQIYDNNSKKYLFEHRYECKSEYIPTKNKDMEHLFKDNSCTYFLDKPTFLSNNILPIIRISEKTATHQYSHHVMNLIQRQKNGLVLDFGCGNTPKKLLFENIIRQDVVLYENVDIIVNDTVLPYKDNTFDLIVSQAVFEHVQYPWEVIKELYRTLKKDGLIYIDTAFMQPRHGDPHHFFNMTLDGLKTICEDFEEIDSGVNSYQQLTDGFIMQMEALKPYINDPVIKEYFSGFSNYIAQNKHKIDDSVKGMGEYIIPAGVFFLGKK